MLRNTGVFERIKIGALFPFFCAVLTRTLQIKNQRIFLDGNCPIWYKISSGMSALGYLCAGFVILRFG
jgi:hypothetical protein